MNMFPPHYRIYVIAFNLSHIGYVIHRVPSRFEYGVRVYPTAITQPYNIVRFPNGALTVRFRSIGPQTPQQNVQARERATPEISAVPA